MNSKDYEHSLILQPRNAAASAAAVTESMNKQIYHLLTLQEIYDAKRVIIVGCGDSWLAGIAAKVVFEGAAQTPAEAMRCIEFSRNLSGKYLGADLLVIGVSVSGTVSRVAEALRRADKHGANTIAVTANGDSIVGKAARHVLRVDLPKLDQPGPGSNNYIGSMIGLVQLALRMARAKNTISQNQYEDMRRSVVDFIAETAEHLGAYEEKAFALAQRWKDLRAYDFIGDYGDYATAYFGSAKVLEAFGGNTTYDDSEDWNHINFFLADPASIGRVIVANRDCPSYSRLRENMDTIDDLGSPCIVVGDCDESDIPAGFALFKTPKAKYPWLYPFVQHMPLGMVAGYIAAIKKTHIASSEVSAFTAHPEVQDATRIRNSEIVVL